jgi:hypothetical protein
VSAVGTYEAVAAESGLPRAVVVKRLRGSGPHNGWRRFIYFARNEMTNRWGVTARGVELAAGADPT